MARSSQGTLAWKPSKPTGKCKKVVVPLTGFEPVTPSLRINGKQPEKFNKYITLWGYEDRVFVFTHALPKRSDEAR